MKNLTFILFLLIFSSSYQLYAGHFCSHDLRSSFDSKELIEVFLSIPPRSHLSKHAETLKMVLFVGGVKAGSTSLSLQEKEHVLVAFQDYSASNERAKRKKEEQEITVGHIQKLKVKPEYQAHSHLLVACALDQLLSVRLIDLAIRKINVTVPHNNMKIQELMERLHIPADAAVAGNYQISFGHKNNYIDINAAIDEQYELGSRVSHHIRKYLPFTFM